MDADQLSPAALALRKLGGKTVLEREKAASELHKLLADPSQALELELTSFEPTRIAWLGSPHWEQRLGAISALNIAMKHLPEPSLARRAVRNALSLLIDLEVRVRFSVGECLGGAATILGAEVWKTTRESILGNIKHCWDRDALAPELADAEPLDRTGARSRDFVSDLLQSSYHRQRPGVGEMRHGTEGWQALETSFVALRRIAEGTGQPFMAHCDADLLELLYKACKHPNRFIRETTYHILAAVCSFSDELTLQGIGDDVAGCLEDGLSENWSQVRYAACVCARAFLLAVKGFQDRFFPKLLPPLCFNRYDVAEGVRYYSLETWKLIMEDSGPKNVAAYIDQVVSYYVRCAKTNNHTVREAACSCLAELFVKIEKAALEKHVPKIQRTLLRALKDDSWTVRDAASIAYGKAVLAFPEACRPALPEIWPLWLGLLDDNVFSVREHAAAALADVTRAFGAEVLDLLVPLVRERLLRAKEQPAVADANPFSATGASAPSSSEYQINSRRPAGSKQPSPPEFGGGSSAGSTRENRLALDLNAAVRNTGGSGLMPPAQDPGRVRSPRLHRFTTAAQDELFKEGALLKAKAKDTGGIDYSCGCMDYGFRRDKEPWEAADGAVYMLAELCSVAPAVVPPLLPVLADVALLDHWPLARSLQATIWSKLPEILNVLGKKVFKPHLELFIEALFRSLECENQLCRTAAGRCLGAFRDALGPRIFSGRLSEQQQAVMAASPDVPPPAGLYAGVAERVFETAPQAPARLSTFPGRPLAH